MEAEDMMLDAERFVSLDVLNTLSENEIVRGHHIVQIVDQLSKKSYFEIKAIMNRFGRTLKPEEKRKHVFTITLNQDAGYQTQRFR